MNTRTRVVDLGPSLGRLARRAKAGFRFSSGAAWPSPALYHVSCRAAVADRSARVVGGAGRFFLAGGRVGPFDLPNRVADDPDQRRDRAVPLLAHDGAARPLARIWSCPSIAIRNLLVRSASGAPLDSGPTRSSDGRPRIPDFRGVLPAIRLQRGGERPPPCMMARIWATPSRSSPTHDAMAVG